MNQPWEKDCFEGMDMTGQLLPQELLDYVKAHDKGLRYLLVVRTPPSRPRSSSAMTIYPS